MKRLKISIFLLVLLFIGIESLYAQMETGRSFSVELGIQKHKEIDHIISPLRYENTVMPVLVTFKWDKTRYKQYLFGGFYSSDLTAITENSRSLDVFTFGYGYLRKLNPFLVAGHPAFFSVGLEWNNLMHLNQQRIAEFGVILNSSGYFSSDINLSGDFDLHLGRRHRLSYVFKTPLLQYIVRPGFSLFRPNEESDTVLGNLKEGSFEFFLYGSRFDQEVRYAYRIGRKFDLTTSYRYNINTLPDPRMFKSIQRGITLGTVINF